MMKPNSENWLFITHILVLDSLQHKHKTETNRKLGKYIQITKAHTS